MSPSIPAKGSASNTGRYKRSARNYLLDPRFQLKYTGLLVLVALFLSGLLGTQLWYTSKAVIAQSQHAVEQGKETVRRGQKTIEESKKVSEVVSMNIARDYADNPELAALFKGDTEKHDKALISEQKALEDDAKALEGQQVYLEEQQKRTLYVLLGGIAILVLAIGMAGIVFTHKIAGPVYKMTGLLRQVGEGKLNLEMWLRKGDELRDFFEAFRSMVGKLRDNHVETMTRLEKAIEDLEGEVDAAKIKPLRELHQDMKARLES